MDPDPQISAYLLLSLIFIISCSFFAAAETAIISLNDNKLKEISSQGNKRALCISRMVSEPTRFLTTVQIGIVFSQLTMSAFVSSIFSIGFIRKFKHLLSFIPLSESSIHIVVTVIITILLTFFTILFGHSLPKKISGYYCDKLSLFFAPLLMFFYVLFYPLFSLLNFFTAVILKIFKISFDNKEDDITEEEIRMLVDAGNEKGVIEQSEKDMIDNIFEFDDTTASDLMTHRTDLIALEKKESALSAAKLSLSHGYSRIPVYDEEIDNIVGVLNIKDLLTLIGKNPEAASTTPVCNFVRPVMFIPESNKCSDLFATFQNNRVQIAVVVDEYGGTAGIVTMEDLLESIVGNIQDEYDNEEEEVIKLAENVYSLDGSISIDDVEKLLDIEIENGEDYDTLGGLLTDINGGIPSEIEHPLMTIGDVQFTVLIVKDRRIQRVKAEKYFSPHKQ